MSKEAVHQPKPQPIVCESCYGPVQVGRDREEFILRCECRTLRNVELTEDMPVSWS